MALVKNRKCIGFLRKESPLIDIFPDREVPLKSPVMDIGKGRNGERVELYEVDLARLSEGKVKQILVKLEQILDEKVDRAELEKEGYRLKAEHFDGFAFDARLIA